MAKSKQGARPRTAEGLAANPYVKRLIEDEELRDNIRDAYDSARERLRAPATTARRRHRPCWTTRRSTRTCGRPPRTCATRRTRSAQEERSAAGRRLLAVAVAGAVLALVLSEDARKAVLDKLFGAEEEFEYTSTTTVNGSGSAASATEAAASSS